MKPQTNPLSPVLSVAKMTAAEDALMAGDVTVHDLMQRAGNGAAELIWRTGTGLATQIVCGPGNNGGDGYVIAEYLRRKGMDVSALEALPPKTDAAKRARELYQGKIAALDTANPATQFIDCLFGSGLKRPIKGQLWADFLRLAQAARRRIAIDLPSGVEADSGALLNSLPEFDLCIALGAWKYAHYLQPAAGIVRQKKLVDIGVETGVEAGKFLDHVLTRPEIAKPAATAHKYSRGLVAIVAGAMPGAAVLAARAAQASGAGYVKILSAQSDAQINTPSDIVAVHVNGTAGLASELADERISAVLIGPGLGRDSAARELFQTTLASDKPLVIDADAIHLLAGHNHAENNAPLIATPHGGEFKALVGGISGFTGKGSKAEQTREAASRFGLYLLHKGPDTVIADPEGRIMLSDAASSWLAVAGSGDALAGSVAARLAGHGDAMLALKEAQWLHGRAARLAGPSFTAWQLAEKLASALEECL